MSYAIMGRVIVERRIDPDEIEVLEYSSISDKPMYPEANSDLTESIFSEKDVPSAPGIYVIMYVADITGYSDSLSGDWETEVDLKLRRTIRLDEQEATEYLLYVNDLYGEING